MVVGHLVTLLSPATTLPAAHLGKVPLLFRLEASLSSSAIAAEKRLRWNETAPFTTCQERAESRKRT
jgi:hypothetical protein